MAHEIEHGSITEDDGIHEPKGVSTATVDQVYVADGALSGAWAKLEGTKVASTGETGAIKYLREDGDDTSSWQAAVAEGTAILSTGETGASKFLREDGDNSSSWQLVNAAAIDTTTVADKSILVADGAGGAAWQAIPYQGVYDDNIGAHTVITGSGAAMTRLSDVVVNAAASATGVEFTANADSSITYTGSLTRHFHIACSLALDLASGTNVTCQAQLQKFTSGPDTWAAVPGSNVQFNIAATGAAASTAIHGDISLATNDKLVLAIENTDTATNLEVVTMYLFAVGMPGT